MVASGGVRPRHRDPDDAVLTILLAGILLLAAGALTSAVQRESSIESDERPTVELPPLDAAA